MIHQVINLPVHYREKGINNNFYQPTLTTYIMQNCAEYSEGRKRPLVIVCPGGAYFFKSEREAEPIAIKLNSLGFQAVVLRYSTAPMEYPTSFLDTCEAVKYVRDHATDWAVDPDKIILAGFSAGGHLAAHYGIYWNTELARKYLDYKPEDLKINGLLLCYPVITSGEKAHRYSFEMLTNKDDSLLDEVSLEKHVNENVPPVFMWHTYEDESVPVENSLMFAAALKEKNIPLELHIFAHGGHGLSLATAETSKDDGLMIQESCAMWPELFAKWVKTLK